MNPNKEAGLCDVYGNFGCGIESKSDGWRCDIDAILEAFENKSTCEKSR